MSRLIEFRKLEQQLAAQLAELESLKGDAGLTREIEFEQKLRALLEAYGVNLRQVIEILDPHSAVQAVGQVPAKRKPRAVKVYKNPHTDEVIETKGGNHKRLKEWKAQYGAATVESWVA
ncbi:DNA binding protein [Pseudomonas sp. p1(2021b)]|uniref:histone-like nucleoid-structuring protein, MvaT/MvaU family n=1 Tax=Pseudomonas sp. p1(2021b) TaxID=2874628 RepID=UPI001CCDD08F|nr:histone-like nucleoid-structuring protein, MvaT/MvaU family [Pseudomonas sp. p1(2021b)]UBM24158.1 DNA binding protein [Pseudomonas sp. p1(2021b)]